MTVRRVENFLAHLKVVRRYIRCVVISDLNATDGRSIENRVVISGDTTKKLKVNLEPNYADHELVVGPRYQREDFKCIWTTNLGTRVSGVCGITSIFSLLTILDIL